MHLRKLILVCGFACVLISNIAAALGLGEVRLNSKLNEPLNAEIKLLDTRGLGAGQVIVGLASPADFERNGVERHFFLTEFEFEVLLNHPSGALVRVTSRSPIREPFINFLVEAKWPTGRLLREYTLLMDLPTFSEKETPASVRTPTAEAAPSQATPNTGRTPPPRQSPATASAPSERAIAPAASRSAVSGDTYTVGANDTLWQIALDVRPDNSHSVHQTMLAIQRLNPDAFINNNINLLRKGQVLRIPAGDEIRSLPVREAVNEVVRQNQAWSDEGMGAQLSAARRETRTSRETDPISGSLRLATPGRDDGAGSGQGSGDNSGRGRALETELTTSLEELDRARAENRELSSRVQDLEEQIRTMERLVDVSNEQLRALQLSANQNQQTNDVETEPRDPIPAQPTEPDTYGLEAEEPSSVDPFVTTEPVDQAPSVTADPEPVPEVSQPTPIEARRTVVPPPPPKTVVDHLMDNLLWVILGIIVLIIVAAVVMHRRRQAALENDNGVEDDLFDMDADTPEDDYDEAALDVTEDGDLDDESLLEEEPIPAEAETGDVVAEADIYIAYGKFEQAEDMLLNGLAKDPDSVDIRLKLLEVYSQTQDVEKFDRYYASLLGVAGRPALARAAELREHIIGAPEFEESAYATGNNLGFAEDDIAVSRDEAVNLRVADDASYSEDDLVDDDLDLSLDLEGDAEPLIEEEHLTTEMDVSAPARRYDLSFEEQPAESAEEDEFTFDFDLDDESATESVAEEQQTLEETEEAFSLMDDGAAETPAVQDEEDLALAFNEEVEERQTLEEVPYPAEGFETSDEDLQLPEDTADDFDLDMAMEDLDLAALDEEMKDLDDDLVEADDRQALELELDDEPASLAADTRSSTTDYSADFTLDEPELDDKLTADSAKVSVSHDELDDEEVFAQALAELDTPSRNAETVPRGLSDDDMDAELDFLADADEAATKLDLARAYIDMGDTDGARDILAEVANEGNDQQRQEAAALLNRIDV